MAKDLKAFLERMKEDSAFAEEVKETGDRIKKDEENLGEGEVLVRAAKELGYEFTMDDIERHIAEDQEVDDKELAKAAGGSGEESDSSGTAIENILDILNAKKKWCWFSAYYCVSVEN